MSVEGWFPWVSYLEEEANGVLPNVYEWPWDTLRRYFSVFVFLFCILLGFCCDTAVAGQYKQEQEAVRRMKAAEKQRAEQEAAQQRAAEVQRKRA